MDLDSYFKKKLKCINEKLNQLVPIVEAPYATLFHAAKYSINTPGKRLRPILTLATVEMLGGDCEAALTPACALEMIHTYSMIHDDLPCMDNDDFRRGMPTLHKLYPEAIAVLSGDFLLTYAFQVVSQSPLLDEKKKVELISLFAQRAGGEGMIAGQIMDIESENKEVSFETLKLIHRKKTGELISAAIEIGAIIADVAQEVRIGLRQFGYHIGLAFQIIDDILDVTHPEVKHGKTVSSDVVNQKVTSVTHLGIEKASEMALGLIKQAHAELEIFSFDSTILQKITEYVVSRKH